MDRKWAYAWGMNQAILESLEATLTASGRTTTLIPVYEQEPPEQIWKKIQSIGIDSVFSIHYGSSELFSKLETAGIPVVVVMNNNYQTLFNSVCVDDYQGAYEAGSILIRNGHRRLAYLSADLPLLTAVRTDRLIGFRKALEEHGVSLPASMQPVCDLRCLNKIEHAVDELLGADDPPTGVFVMDDYVGVRAFEALRRRGVRIPEQLSLICAGDVLDYDEPFVPQMSTMSIQFTSMGRAAGELMLSQIGRAPEEQQHEVLKVKQHYVERGTVAPSLST
jgi:LacI family transcriptional regulator